MRWFDFMLQLKAMTTNKYAQDLLDKHTKKMNELFSTDKKYQNGLRQKMAASQPAQVKGLLSDLSKDLKSLRPDDRADALIVLYKKYESLLTQGEEKLNIEAPKWLGEHYSSMLMDIATADQSNLADVISLRAKVLLACPDPECAATQVQACQQFLATPSFSTLNGLKKAQFYAHYAASLYSLGGDYRKSAIIYYEQADQAVKEALNGKYSNLNSVTLAERAERLQWVNLSFPIRSTLCQVYLELDIASYQAAGLVLYEDLCQHAAMRDDDTFFLQFFQDYTSYKHALILDHAKNEGEHIWLSINFNSPLRLPRLNQFLCPEECIKAEKNFRPIIL